MMAQRASSSSTEASVLRAVSGQHGLAGCPRKLNNVLLLADQHPDSKGAISFAIGLAEHFDSHLTLMHGGDLRSQPAFWTTSSQDVPDPDQTKLALLCLLWEIRPRCPEVTLSRARGRVPEEVWKAALLHAADLIVLPEGLTERFLPLLGRNDQSEVIANAPCPVLIVSDGPEQPLNPQRIQASTPSVAREVMPDETRTASVPRGG